MEYDNINSLNTKGMKKVNQNFELQLPVSPKAEVDGASKLPEKTIPELLELKERQLKLLNNKSFINRLPDRGAKIQAFHDKIVSELKLKQELIEEDAHVLLEKLNLNIDEDSVKQVEWEGNIRKRQETYLDSDDDSDPEDVMQILSQTRSQEKQVKVLQPEKLLVTSEDLRKIGEIPHIKYIVDRTQVKCELNKTQERFKPYNTTKSDVHKPEKEILRKKNKHWENTAASPPPIVNGAAKAISIEESLRLQKEQSQLLKQSEALHAAERLLAKIKIGELPTDVSMFGDYRDVDVMSDSHDSDPEGSDKEVHDEEPEKGGIVFTVMK